MDRRNDQVACPGTRARYKVKSIMISKLVAAATEDMNSEILRRVPIYSRKTMELAFEDAEKRRAKNVRVKLTPEGRLIPFWPQTGTLRYHPIGTRSRTGQVNWSRDSVGTTARRDRSRIFETSMPTTIASI
jgi:hypothetical protein